MKLSIITVNKNNAAGLKKTIESVICQTFKDFEFIIIDGASTDESVNVIKKYSTGVNYWISEPDNGVYDAMNKGIIAANGEYCLFLNSGDYLSSNFVLEKAFEYGFFEDIVYGDHIQENYLGQRKVIKFDVKLSLPFFLKQTINHQSTFIKKRLLIRLNLYRLDFKLCSDWSFCVDAFIHGATFRHIPVIVSVYNLLGMSSDPKNIALNYREQHRIFQELFKYPPLYDSIYSMAFYNDVWNTPGVKFWYNTYFFIQNFVWKIKRFLGKDFYHNNSKFFGETRKIQLEFALGKIRAPKNKKLLIWGTGADSVTVYNYCDYRKIFVYAFLDSDERKQKYALNGRPVFAPKFAFENKNDGFFIVIASRNYCEEISNTCREHGLREGIDFCVPFESITGAVKKQYPKNVK